MDAPLSSPGMPSQAQHQHQHQSSYFSSASGPTSAAQQNQQQSYQSPPVQQRRDETSPFLRDFNLVAEAAKRAQMACLMRDLEGVAI